MATDIFTGGPSGSPIDWSVISAWSAGLPASSSVVEETGAGTDSQLDLTIAGLLLDSGSSLTVDEFLTVTGAGDATFGGANSTLTVTSGITTVESSVTSATGTVNVESSGAYTYEGSGATQTGIVSGDGSTFDVKGSDNSDTITVQTGGIYGDQGSDNGGVVQLQGSGEFLDDGTNDTATVNMSGGGVFLDGKPFSGLIESFGMNGFIGVVDQADSGTTNGYSVDAANHTVTLDFTTASGTDVFTLNFDAASDFSNLVVAPSSTSFMISHYDVFTGATGGGSNAWSTISDWSAGATPATFQAVEQSGAGTLDIPGGGGTEQIAALALDSGAQLTIPSGQTLAVLGIGGIALGGVGSTIDVSGTLTVGSSNTASVGVINVETGGQYTDQGSGNTDTVHLEGGTFTEAGTGSIATVDMAGGGTFNIQAAFGGTISDLNTAGHIDVTETSGAASSYTINGNDTVTLNFAGASPYTLAFDTTVGLSVAISGSGFVITSSTPVCFTSESRIRTIRGEVAVEDLAVGDLAVTATGEARRVIWIGSRTLRNPAREQWPVRVTAGAFGENRPARDLMLSPGHAVCVSVMDEVFVPVGRLINGATIAQAEVSEVTYWHVELESHDVLLAEDLPCESYMDAGNRAFFGREYGRLAEVDPERVAESLTHYARPFVDHGPIVEAICERLAVRAKATLAESESAGMGSGRKTA